MHSPRFSVILRGRRILGNEKFVKASRNQESKDIYCGTPFSLEKYFYYFILFLFNFFVSMFPHRVWYSIWRTAVVMKAGATENVFLLPSLFQ